MHIFSSGKSWLWSGMGGEVEEELVEREGHVISMKYSVIRDELNIAIT